MSEEGRVRKILDPAPPRGELVHMPEPSYLPATTAFGVTLLLVGIVFSWIVSALGAVIAGVAVVIWIRKVRQEIAELPLEHEQH